MTSPLRKVQDKTWMGLILKHSRLTPEVHQWSNTAAPNTMKVTITRTKGMIEFLEKLAK